MPMQMNEAILMVRELTNAAFNHAKAIGDRKDEDSARRYEHRTISKILLALTGSTPTEDQINNIMD